MKSRGSNHLQIGTQPTSTFFLAAHGENIQKKNQSVKGTTLSPQLPLFARMFLAEIAADNIQVLDHHYLHSQDENIQTNLIQMTKNNFTVIISHTKLTYRSCSA